PQLEAVYNQSHRKPRVAYYEGFEEVKKIYEDSLSADEIYFHHLSEKGRELMGDYGEQYWSRIMQKMIHTKQILTDTEKNKQYIHDESTQRNQMLCIPSRFMTQTDYFLYGQKVAFITYKDDQPVGILIDDGEIAHFERTRFIMLWESISKVS
nr:hypothetical protein [Candidatus Woesebacteria bacterium]